MLTRPIDEYDRKKCDALLSSGQWLDTAHQNWQPPGCMMHTYDEKDMTACLQNRKLVFIGDSSTRQTFWATGKKLGIQDQSKENHTSFSMGAKGITIEFEWDPYLNSSRLHRELTAASMSMEGISIIGTTAALLIGGGLWHARYLDDTFFTDRFKRSIETISEYTSFQGNKNSRGAFRRYSFGPLNEGSIVLLAPVPVPLYYALSPERAETITPTKVDSLNMYLYEQSTVGNVTIPWSFSSMTALGAASYQPDGLHIDEDTASRMADVLLNLRCNSVLRKASSKGYPMDKTCCNSYETPNWTQTAILNASLFFLPILIVVTSRDSSRLNFLPSRKISHAITVLALALCYCYYADRTQLFEKVQKQFNATEFSSLCALAFVLGVVSLRRSATGASQKTPHSSQQQAPDETWLSRYQTDEWKGWMQVVVLIYHYTGASQILSVYEVIRLLVASYIFLSGFGHTIFFYRKADYSLRRSAAVLIRLNFLSCILPYLMKTEYLFYYFAPLISFWYMVIYLTMVIGRQRNGSINFLLAKILISDVLVNTFIRTPGVFEILFHVLETTCNIHWDVLEWRFRLQLDSYIVYAGMVCAITFIRLSDVLRSDPLEYRVFGRYKVYNHVRLFVKDIRIVNLVFAVVTPFLYFWFASACPNKFVYNTFFPYISWIPILAFVILRNMSRHARNFHSSIFAWVGRHSLETFTLQFHIWLAADTKGLLALGVFERSTGGVDGGRKVDFVVLTVIFLWVCRHVAAATQTLTNWIIDPSEEREDVRIDDNVYPKAEWLPSTKSQEDVREGHGQSRAFNGIGVGAMQSASKLKKLVAGDLRMRLALIVLVLWVLNVVSGQAPRSSSPQWQD